MIRVVFVKARKIVHACYIDDHKVIDADGKAARGPMIMDHHTPDENGVYTVRRELSGESVFEPGMCGEEYRDCIMVLDHTVEHDSNGNPVKTDAHVGGTFDGAFGPPVHTADEIDAAREGVRRSVQAELHATAWTQASDEPEDTKKKWAVYRANLRALAANVKDPFGVIYPVRP